MKHRNNKLLLATASSFLMVSPTLAAVSADEAKVLGSTLTPIGAEAGGNKEGTIPAYDPKPLKLPAGWDRKTKGYPDLWNEKPMYSITAQNAAQYADKLDAQTELFKKYPNYRMDIYPTHRAVWYPKYYIDNTVKNATECKGEDNEMKLVGCYGGIPFPLPKSGRQEMWNHLLAYQTAIIATHHLQTWVTPSTGSAVLQSTLDINGVLPPFMPAKAGQALKSAEVYYKARIDFIGPARQVGTKLLFMWSMDTLGVGARAWQYIPGQRRVKLAPDLAYDTPSPASGGASTMDEQQGFLGAVDRYDFKLAGKKEKYILYNNVALTDPKTCPDSKVMNNAYFPVPECMRYELHRVWKVEAKLLPGFRHIYHRRAFYFDEDGHGAGATENYDSAGKLYRSGGIVAVPFFDPVTGGIDSQSTVIMDLNTGTWTFNGSQGTEDAVWYSPPTPQPDTYFSPEALAGEGIR